jgi:hypothetical protein
MATHSTVPSDIDPESMIDLVEDCREVSGVLAPFVIDLTYVPGPRTAPPLDISAGTAATLDGYGEYGS